MKPKALITAVILLALLSGCKDCHSRQTTKPNDLKKLLATNKCRGCHLGSVDLSNANLAGADLREAKLVNAILDGASLAKADLSRAELSWEDFDSGWGGFNYCIAVEV